jgi:hypothetical protein
MNYKIDPGLYAVGNPDKVSSVLVSANYKLTFDTLRKNLVGLDCWLLILDTNGINVWCAAGKGTFGTDELVNRIEQSGLYEIVEHRNLILPQLGAVGVSSHEVKRLSGFAVIYGPVRANDIKTFIASGNKATKEMRTVKFTLADRLVLTPVEFMNAARKSLSILGVLFLLNLFAARVFGFQDFIAYAGAVLTGTVVAPVSLPFVPGRALAWKGWLLGLLWAAGAVWLFGWHSSALFLAIGYLLLLPALSAFLTMNFTGSTPYTSFSGVIKELKIALPLIAVSSSTGVALILIETFTG